MKKLLVISAPSGGGKSTIAKHILSNYPNFSFSVSATTRSKREGEIDGRNYLFITRDEFLFKIADNQFIEYEKIFNNYYGTLKSNINQLLDYGKFVLFDIDVKGALSIKKIYGDEALLLFILPPSLEVLEERLRKRESETDEQIKTRLSRYKEEMAQIDQFDAKVINDKLDDALKEVDNIINKEFYAE